jgi:hypothetical protein
MTEPAGTSAAVARGTVTIRKGETVLATAALQPGSGTWDEYAPFRLTDPADVGPLEAALDAYPTAAELPFTLVAAQQ